MENNAALHFPWKLPLSVERRSSLLRERRLLPALKVLADRLRVDVVLQTLLHKLLFDLLHSSIVALVREVLR